MPEKDTSVKSAFWHSLDQPLENAATTFQVLGWEGTEEFLRDLVEAPENYDAAAEKFINTQAEGFFDQNWEHFPRALFEQLGQIAGSLITRGVFGAAGATIGPVSAAVGAILGPSLFEAIQIAGPVALEHARNDDREEPTWEDWKYALPATAVSGVLNAIGIKNVGVLNKIGKTGYKQAGKNIAKAGLGEGVTEGLQGTTEQVGGTAGTLKGLTIDPKAAYGEALLGAGAGGTTQVVPSGVQLARDVITSGKGELTVEGATPVLTEMVRRQEAQEPTVEPTLDTLYREQYPSLAPFFSEQDLEIMEDRGMGMPDYSGEMWGLTPLEEVMPLVTETMETDYKGTTEDAIYKEIVRDVVQQVREHPEIYVADNIVEADRHNSLIELVQGRIKQYAAEKETSFEEDSRFKEASKKDTDIYGYKLESLTNETRSLTNTYEDSVWEDDHGLSMQEGMVPSRDYFDQKSGFTDETASLLGSVQNVFYDNEKGLMLRNRDPQNPNLPAPIEPVFMSRPFLWSWLLSGSPRSATAEEWAKHFYLKRDGAWFVPAKETTKKYYTKEEMEQREAEGKKKQKWKRVQTTVGGRRRRIAEEAIDNGVAEYLRDRSGQEVSRQEILNVFKDGIYRNDMILLQQQDLEYPLAQYPRLTMDSEFIKKRMKRDLGERVKRHMNTSEGRSMSNEEGTEWIANEKIKLYQKYEELLPVYNISSSANFEETDKAAVEPWKTSYDLNTQLGYLTEGNDWLRSHNVVGPNYIELVGKRNARLSEEEEAKIAEDWSQEGFGLYEKAGAADRIRRDSKYSYPKSMDSGHNWTGHGTNFWGRGPYIEELDADGNPTGAQGFVFAEAQSNMHGHAQSKRKPRYKYRSETLLDTEESEKTIGVFNRIQTLADKFRFGERAELEQRRFPNELGSRGGLLNAMIASVEPESPAVSVIENARGLRTDYSAKNVLANDTKNPLENAVGVLLDAAIEEDLVRHGARPNVVYDMVTKDHRQKLLVMLQRPDGEYGHWTSDLKDALSIPPDTTVQEHLEEILNNKRVNKLVKSLLKSSNKLEKGQERAEKKVLKEALKKEQPFLSTLGIRINDAQIEELVAGVPNIANISRGSRFVFSTAGRFLEDLGVDTSDVAAEQGITEFNTLVDSAKGSTAVVYRNKRLASLKKHSASLRRVFPQVNEIMKLYASKQAPTITQLEEARRRTTEGSRGDYIHPDFPFKNRWGNMLLRGGIVKLMKAYPDMTHVWIPDRGDNESIVGPYQQMLKEAKAMESMFKEYGVTLEEAGYIGREFTDPITGERKQRKMYKLHIEPLREILPVHGYPGMKEGGLVLPAVNHVMNYGSYGRKIL